MIDEFSHPLFSAFDNPNFRVGEVVERARARGSADGRQYRRHRRVAYRAGHRAQLGTGWTLW